MMLAAQQGEHADAPSRALKDGQGGKRSVHLTTTETDGDTPPKMTGGCQILRLHCHTDRKAT